MCGIAGILNLNNQQISLTLLQEFTDSMEHRGPDGSGYKLLQNNLLGLGHRRLSILDLTDLGKQPMSYLEDRYWITFNGEIFNFIELRKELEQKGFKFKSDSDTEVILAAYHCWGKDCLFHFNGMWAFAIWDNIKKTLWLARDRFGIKPLYFFYLPENIFAFASETNAFNYLKGHNRIFNHQKVQVAILNSFSLDGYGETIFENIFSLLPGECLELNVIGNIQRKIWWNTIDFLSKKTGNYQNEVETFNELFLDACKLRLRSDVSIGTALSGGLDSSSVYCMLHHIKSQNKNIERLPTDWLRAFSAIFPGTEQDEQKYAQDIINHVNGDITYIHQNKIDLPSKIIESVQHLDFIYNTPLFMGSEVYRGMRQQNILVSMDGHGVDEMMYGYPASVLDYYKQKFFKNQMEADSIWNIYENMETNSVLRNNRPPWNKYKRKNFVSYAKLGLKGILKNSPIKHSDPILYNLFHKNMLPTILRNFDKMAMQHGVEIRMPFMDWRIVCFVFSLPTNSKLGNGFTKRILRDSMINILPENVRIRTSKLGLNAPMVTWFGNDLKDFIMDHCHSTSFVNQNYWDGTFWKDFAEKRILNNTWTASDCISFWPIMNAHLLINSK